ncbi:NosD domain-containing protein [Bartonella schoenbuchensis]|uniref:NosD domain-containing protein n=1 Tax=Bartonella schoenbuchensis TaxID=165694 RepID=UPI0031CC95EA
MGRGQMGGGGVMGGRRRVGSGGGLSGENRNINMSVHSGQVAVTVYNKSGGETAKIRISSSLKVTDSGGKNNNPAIKVERGGELALVGGVNVTGVKKGIVVEGPRSSVMVLQGTIGVRAKGGPVIEVKNGGEVMLMKGVKVGTVSENVNGEVVINNGGTVELMGTGLSVSKGTGIKIKGATGMATVRGGATITVKQGGTGMEMDMSGGTANVMELNINGSGGNGTGVLINGRGTVTLTKVTMKDVAMGARVTGGNATVMMMGGSITVGGDGTGLDVSGMNATVTMMSGTITVGRDGTGMSVSGGKATMVMGSITGNGSGSKGVEVKGRANVTLTSVTMKDVDTGVEVDGGTLKLEGKTTIKVGGSGSGIYAKSGTLMMSGMTTINVTGVGDGLKVSGGTVMMMGKTTITGSGSGKGVYVGGGVLMVEGVDISEVATGVYMEGGTLTVEGGTIRGNGNTGTGIFATGGKVTLTSVDISKVATGVEVDGGTLTVEGGEIGFTKDYGVYVGESVTKASLMDVKIVGENKGKGVVMKGGTVTMMRVNISEVATGIYATGGKSLTVKGGTIRGNGSGKGVWVKGGAANVTLEGVNISQVETGIYATGGKSLTVKGGEIGFTKDYGYGIYVGKKVTRASLTNVTITGKGKGVYAMGEKVMVKQVDISNVERGIYAGGGTLKVEGGTIRGVEAGIMMKGSGELKVEGGTRIEFEGEYGYGIYVGEGVRADLTDVTITGRGGSGSGYGVYAMGGEVTVSGVTRITGVKAGIFAVKGGTLIMKEGTRIQFKGSDGYGVYVGKGVRAELTGVTIEGNGYGYGIEVAKEGAVWLKGTHLRNVAKGMTISKGVVVMVEGSVEFKGEYGIDLTRGYAFLGEVNIEGKETGQEGIKVSEGMLNLYKTNVRGVYKGMTVWRGGIRMFGGSVEFTGDYGIDLTRGYAFLGEVNIEGKETGQEGIKVSEGMLNLYKTNVRGVYKGMTIEEGVVRMEGGSVEFKGEHGISLTGGYADLRGVNMTYKSDGLNANFIKVEGGKVLAEGITITGNGGKGQGVKVANGGAVWLKETNFTNVRSGISISEGSVFMFKGGITFKGEYGIYLSKGQALLSDFNITGPGGTSKTTATGIGVVVNSLGEVMMREVNISGVEMGARVTSGLLVMDKGSITFKGKHGINLIRGHALLNGVNITGPGSGTGIELGYGQVLMKGTTFTNVDKAITVTEGDVRMEGGEIEFKGGHGILLGQGGVALMGVTMRYKGNSTTADFIKITGEDTTNAVEAVDPKTRKTFTPKSAVVVAASLKIDGNGHGQALNVTNGGRVVLVNPTYTDVYSGMTIEKGAVQMIEGSMEFKGGHGIYLKRGHALLTNVTMTYKGHEKNTTFLKVEATKVFNSKNERVLNTADIRVTGIKIDGKGYGQGVYVANGGRVMLQSALLSNVINGVSVANGEFWMKGGEIAFKGDYGVSLSTGKVVLKGVIMEYKGNNRGAKGANTASPNFIKVEGKGANLVAIKVMFTGDEARQGVRVANEGHVTLKHMFFLHCV